MMEHTLRNQKYYSAKQRGATLIIALVLLLVVTIIGVAGMKTTAVEEKMSGSFRDHQLSFESAEQALLEGENFIETTDFVFANYTASCSNGLCFTGAWDSANPNASCNLNSTGTDVWVKTSGTNYWNNSRTVSDVLAGVGQPPQYMIEFLCHAPTSTSTTLPPYVAGTGWEAQHGLLFRITALGTGGSNKARVMLQSTYLKPMS